jgi:glycosyltransferase involved in cell wall biosynthesis
VKTVYADLLGRVGYRVRQLLEHPPDGYRFISRALGVDRFADSFIRVNALWKLRHLLNRAVPTNLLVSASLMRYKKIPHGVSLTYSESPLIFRPEPWVVGVECCIQFAGYDLRHLQRYRHVVEATLAAPYCRKIICWSEAARRSLLKRLDPEPLERKVAVVHPAGSPKEIRPVDGAARRGVKILFVSSAVTPGGFAPKGGREALEAFRALRPRYPDLELVIRCDVPAALRAQYAGTPGLRIIDGLIPREALEAEYRTADIFWFPAHTMMSVVMLEAMSHGLPVITTDYFDNAEFVEDGRTGIVFPASQRVPPWDTSPGEVGRALAVIDPEVVAHLVRATARLVDDPGLRRRLGTAARMEVETGRLSLAHKNRKMKAILDQVTNGS